MCGGLLLMVSFRVTTAIKMISLEYNGKASNMTIAQEGKL